jgi:O-antigen/teichoic acid export membrane protein
VNLRTKSIKATFWSGADVFMRQGLQFFITILLARLLAPEDFGVIALLQSIIIVAGLFVDSGFSSALIQRKTITHIDESTVFFFNLVIAALMSASLYLLAPWIAIYFEIPVLESLIHVMALNVFVGAFGSIHNTLLTKRLDFKTLLKIGAFATSISGSMAIVMAWQGFGVWSLAWQTLLSSVLNVIFLWKLHPWRPRLVFSLVSLRSLFRFGSYMMLSGILDTIHTQIYAVLISKLFSARDLGYYARADSTHQLPVGVLARILNRVAFPIFSEAAEDRTLLLKVVRKVLVVTMLFNIPLMLVLAVLSEQFVITLFGDKWLSSVPYLEILCLAGVIWPLHVVNLNALMAQGRSDLFFRLELIKKFIGIPLVMLASLHSVLAIAWVMVLQGLISFIINAHYSKVLLGYGAKNQLQDILPYLVIGLLVAVSVWSGSLLMDLSPEAELVILSAGGGALYIAICYTFRLIAFKEIIDIIARRNHLT